VAVLVIGVGAYASICAQAVRAIQVVYVEGNMKWGYYTWEPCTFTVVIKILNPSSVSVTVSGTYEVFLSAGGREASFDIGDIGRYTIASGGWLQLTIPRSLGWFSEVYIYPWSRYYVWYEWYYYAASMSAKVKGILHTSAWVYSADVPYEVSGYCQGLIY